MSSTYADHIEQRESAEIKRLEHIGHALDDKRNVWALYDALRVIALKSTDPQSRNRACMTLLLIEHCVKPPTNTELSFSDALDIYQPLSQEL